MLGLYNNIVSSAFVQSISVITSGLKMWLRFEASEPLGREEVVNGDFSDGETGWTFSSGWSVNAQNQATTQGVSQTPISQAVLVNGTNRLTFNVESGGAFVYTNYPIFSKKGTFLTEGLHTIDLESDGVGSNNLLYIYNNGAGNPATIDNISVKELTQITPDLSGNSNVGKLFTGKALDFSGDGESVDIDGFQLAGSDATFAFWINPTEAQNTYILDVNPSRFVIAFSGYELSIYSGAAFFKFGVIEYGEWSRVAIVINGTSASCYVDGVQLGTTKTITAISIGSAAAASIGSIFNGTSTYYDGKLSDFQVYNAVWSASDIAYDYENPNHLVTDNTSTSLTVSNLKGYWALSEGAGTVAYDSSGEGINGTIDGATYTEHETRIPQLGMVDYSISTPASNEVTLVANPSNLSQDIRGTSVRLRENAFNLGLVKADSGTGHAEVVKGSDFNFGTGNFTLEAWVQYKFANTNSTFNAIMGLGNQGAGASNASAHLLVSSSRFYFSVIQVSATSGAGLSLTEGDWYHVVGVRDGTSSKMYVDGDLKASVSNATGDVTNSNNIQIGVDSITGRYYKGLIDDCRIYNKALSQDEITNNYNAGLSAHTN